MLFDADKRFERSDFKRSFSSFIKEINTAFWSLHNLLLPNDQAGRDYMFLYPDL